MQNTTLTNEVIVITEQYLIKWLTRRLKGKVSVGRQIRKQVIIRYYEAICQRKKIVYPERLTASKRWLCRFKARCGAKYANYHGEFALDDETAARTYPEVARKITEDRGYSHRQGFKCDETGVYWRKYLRNILISKELKQTPRNKLK